MIHYYSGLRLLVLLSGFVGCENSMICRLTDVLYVVVKALLLQILVGLAQVRIELSLFTVIIFIFISLKPIHQTKYNIIFFFLSFLLVWDYDIIKKIIISLFACRDVNNPCFKVVTALLLFILLCM